MEQRGRRISEWRAGSGQVRRRLNRVTVEEVRAAIVGAGFELLFPDANDGGNDSGSVEEQ